MREPIPDVLVELLALGELDEAEATEVRAQLEAEDDPRLAEIEASNAAVFERYPIEQVASELREADTAPDTPATILRPRRWALPIAAIVAAAAAAALVLVLSPTDETPVDVRRDGVARVDPPQSRPDGIRTKGVARLFVQRRGDDQHLQPGSAVREGDVLQLSYSGAAGHGVIVSVDGAGVTTLHFPDHEDGPTKLGPGLVRLDHAYELDDAPDFERFFLVTSTDPLSATAVLGAARELATAAEPRTAALSLPGGWSQVSVLVDKRD